MRKKLQETERMEKKLKNYKKKQTVKSYDALRRRRRENEREKCFLRAFFNSAADAAALT